MGVRLYVFSPFLWPAELTTDSPCLGCLDTSFITGIQTNTEKEEEKEEKSNKGRCMQVARDRGVGWWWDGGDCGWGGGGGGG